MDEFLNRLIDLVQETAPEVWEVAMKQGLGNGIGLFVFAVIVSAFSLISLGFAIHHFRIFLALKHYVFDDSELRKKMTWTAFKDERDENEDAAIFMFVVSFLLILSSLPIWYSAIMHMVNPSYYAIKVLLDLV